MDFGETGRLICHGIHGIHGKKTEIKDWKTNTNVLFSFFRVLPWIPWQKKALKNARAG